MSQEIFELVKGMDFKKIETQLALQCAPLIMGLKVSNLFIIPAENETAVKIVLKHSGISYFRLLRTTEKITYLLYRRKDLEQVIEHPKMRDFFQKEGYEQLPLGAILYTFQKRYESYMTAGGVFPHEMGLLLGYPLDDVTGFIEQKGKNYLYAGYWKVYTNMGEKICLFQAFEEAKEALIQAVARGIRIEELVRGCVA